MGTVLIELCAQTKEFKTAAGVDTYMSNDRFARAVGMRTWVLPFDGVGWHPSMSRKDFVVPPRRVLAILLLESGVRAVLLASMQWTLNPLTRTGSGAGGFRASFGWKHLDLVLEEQCDVKEEGGVRVRESACGSLWKWTGGVRLRQHLLRWAQRVQREGVRARGTDRGHRKR